MAKCSNEFEHYSWFQRCVVRRVETMSAQNALLWGVAWLIISSILGWYFRLMPTSAFGFVPTDYVPLMWSLLLGIVVWFTWSLPFIPFALVRNPKTKSFELLGRLLFAHWPVVVLMLPAIIYERIDYATFVQSPTFSFELYPVFSAIMVLIAVVVVVWSMAWSYQAYTVSTGCNKSVDKVIFVVVAIVSAVLSHAVVGYVLVRAIS